jgi:F-type H+-transporting ATPase subunit gamma
MASTQQLKRRIGSVKNTKQITKAMELVAASKMKRAQDTAARSRDYRNLANAILSRLRELTDVSKHPLFVQRPVTNRIIITITSDRGLAGAYNSNVLRRLTKQLQTDNDNGIVSKLVIIGKQAANFAAKLEGIEVLAVYQDFPESPSANDIAPILSSVTTQYKDLQVDAVDLLYTDFKSSINQEVTVQRLLPAAFSEVEISPDLENAVFEPSAKAVLNSVTERLIEVNLSQALLESQASEHSMRMMAMKSATDNAGELIDDLTLAFNTARQAGITQELAEITGGAEAIK